MGLAASDEVMQTLATEAMLRQLSRPAISRGKHVSDHQNLLIRISKVNPTTNRVSKYRG
jgi:hypothetical protein